MSPTTVLPVTLIDFTAQPGNKNILLSWSTSLEINNSGFAVERSLDGSGFKQIGWVNGQGTTALKSAYNFTDNFVQPNVIYYYRLRQTDINNRQVISAIRNARVSAAAGISISVSPNPANGYVNIFVTGSTNKSTIELVNAAGQRLKRISAVNAYDGNYRLHIPATAKGTCSIVVYLPEGTYTRKVVIE